MREGKKVLARELVETAFENVKRIQLEKYHKASEEEKSTIELNPKQVFHKAVLNCKPVLALTPIKRGGVTYQVRIILIIMFHHCYCFFRCQFLYLIRNRSSCRWIGLFKQQRIKNEQCIFRKSWLTNLLMRQITQGVWLKRNMTYISSVKQIELTLIIGGAK